MVSSIPSADESVKAIVRAALGLYGVIERQYDDWQNFDCALSFTLVARRLPEATWIIRDVNGL